ncbi:MAG: ATP-binding protein [Prevotellaceae bacterium]|jgi:AAA15 family ATPase/GTPase|nr:ATP-binding protein [Prevotellaceae bacterium]
MLLEFSVANFLSFKEKKTISLISSGISDYKDDNLFDTKRYSVLKGAIIYGANSSGKSNLIRAMSAMRQIVIDTFNQSSTKPLPLTPFLLNSETENAPSFFEVLFEIDNIRYRYGFEATKKEIVSEWLFEAKKNVEKYLFIRQKEGIDVSSSYKEGANLEEKTRENALFLSVVDQFNGSIAKKIMNWFSKVITIFGLNHENYELVTFKFLENKTAIKSILDFYKTLDLGFDGLKINKKKFDIKEIPEDTPESLIKMMIKDLEGSFKFNIKTLHQKFNENNEITGTQDFDMRSQESAGTNKIFDISGPVFDVLHNGGILIVDELDSSLHPLMTLEVTKLFNSKVNNPKNAQLIFTTHDTNLFSYGKYRRDQIYFVEKDKYGASDLYSLVEYKEEDGTKIRKDRSFEKDYIQGRYGAIPFIGNISKILQEWQEK